MPNDKKTETLLKYVTDVHALVSHGLTTMKRQAENLKSVSHEDARKAVPAFVSLLQKQDDELHARIKSLGGSASQPVKDAVSAVAGVAAGVVNAVRPTETPKSIRDDHTYFNHLGIAWMMLFSTASSLGDTETASMSERGYDETTKAILHINHILPKIVVEELREDKELNPSDSADKTREMTKAAWSHEAPTSL